MNKRAKRILKIALYAFIPWIVVLGILSGSLGLPETWFIIIHYIIEIFFFALFFAFFFNAHTKPTVFETSIIAMLWIFLFEFIALNFFSSNYPINLNFVDWIFPMFLMISTIYGTGKLVR